MFSKNKRPEKEKSIGMPRMKNPPPPPSKKSFVIMREMISDAERWDNKGEPEISKAILSVLCDYIKTII